MIMFGGTRFHDANPKLSRALVAALQDAMDLIHTDPSRAAAICSEVSGDRKSTREEIMAQTLDPETFYERTPRSLMPFADSMAGTGLLKARPAAWSDIFFADLLP